MDNLKLKVTSNYFGIDLSLPESGEDLYDYGNVETGLSKTEFISEFVAMPNDTMIVLNTSAGRFGVHKGNYIVLQTMRTNNHALTGLVAFKNADEAKEWFETLE